MTAVKVEGIDKIIIESIEQSSKESERVARVMRGLNADLYASLDKYTDDNGVIPTSRLNSFNAEIKELEAEYLTEIEDALIATVESVIDEVTEATYKELEKIPDVSAMLTSTIMRDTKELALEELLKRKVDEVKVDSRIKALTISITALIGREVRNSILLKKKASDISKRVDDVIKSNTWTVKKLITSEVLTSIRLSILKLGDKLGILKGIKIIDNRGRHGGHHLHKCFKYAEEDKYGMGKGVYKTTDTYILDPHPQCTAYFEFILKDKYSTGRDADAE